MSLNSKMTAIADKIRALLGLTGTMGLDAMANHLGDAVTEVDNQNGIIAQLKDAIAENVSKTSSEVSEQTTLIQQIKAALADKATPSVSYSETENSAGGTTVTIG